jgi:plastocyanin
LNIGATIVVLETKETLKVAPNSKVFNSMQKNGTHNFQTIGQFSFSNCTYHIEMG